MLSVQSQEYDSKVAINPECVQSKHGIRTKMLVIIASLDLFMISLGLCIAAWWYLGRIDHPRLITFLPLTLPIYFLVALRQRAFRAQVIISGTRSSRRAVFSLLLALTLAILLIFFLKASESFSRGLALLGGGLACALVAISRALFARYAFYALNGSPESEVVFIDGVMPPPTCAALKINVPLLGIRPDINDPVMLDRIGQIIHAADRVIVACPLERRADWSRALKGAGVNVEVLAPELDAIGAIHTTNYHGTATATIATGPLNPVDRLIKRTFDLSMSIGALLVLFPLFLLIALSVKLDSRGPIFFIQQRIGRGNRMFRMYKFRSMHFKQTDNNASRLVTRGDARITRIGGFLRKTSLDEIPQLFNVLRGEMSIVGPRPHATGALAGGSLYWEVSPKYWNRHAVKPGLTGLAQVRGFRGNTETGDDLINRVQADLAYLDDWSIWRDVALVFQTFGVLIHRNAF